RLLIFIRIIHLIHIRGNPKLSQSPPLSIDRGPIGPPRREPMSFAPSPRTAELLTRLQAFMDEHIYPNEERYHREINEGDRWQPIALIDELKEKAKAKGLWNLF